MQWLDSVFKADQPAADILRRKFEQVEAHSATLPGLPHHLLTRFTSPPCSLKNRYRLVLPLSEHRVRLGNGQDDDYINASFVDGKRYIATQAPLPRSFADFWQMVVEQRVPVIVMLVRVQPRKAEQYWPDRVGMTIMHGDRFEVTVDECMTVFEGLVKRRILVHDFASSTRHAVTHYYYDGWPDHGPPRSCADFNRLHDALSSDLHNASDPVVVHCSAGVGRTGCFITIDRLYRQYHVSSDPDPDQPDDTDDAITRFIMDARRHRPWFVETEEQFAFIYEYFWWLKGRAK